MECSPSQAPPRRKLLRISRMLGEWRMRARLAACIDDARHMLKQLLLQQDTKHAEVLEMHLQQRDSVHAEVLETHLQQRDVAHAEMLETHLKQRDVAHAEVLKKHLQQRDMAHADALRHQFDGTEESADTEQYAAQQQEYVCEVPFI